MRADCKIGICRNFTQLLRQAPVLQRISHRTSAAPIGQADALYALPLRVRQQAQNGRQSFRSQRGTQNPNA